MYFSICGLVCFTTLSMNTSGFYQKGMVKVNAPMKLLMMTDWSPGWLKTHHLMMHCGELSWISDFSTPCLTIPTSGSIFCTLLNYIDVVKVLTFYLECYLHPFFNNRSKSMLKREEILTQLDIDVPWG